MIGELHIPLGFGDCVNGFKYDGVIAERDYVRKMVDEYNSHKGIIDHMMRTSFEHNMSINNFKKEKRKYKQQDVEFEQIRCYVDNKNFNPMEIDELLEHFEKNESFILVVRIFNVRELKDNPDISIDFDVTFATDGNSGLDKSKYGDITLGKGPVICYGPEKSHRLNMILKETAGTYHYQEGAGGAGGTNTDNIQKFSDDCETTLVSIPNRSMHTRVEVCDWRDVQGAVDMVSHSIMLTKF